MTNKDFIKILLTTYGYTHNIKIDTYKLYDGTAYEISAENPENGNSIYIDSDNFQSAIYYILDDSDKYNIKPTIKFVDLPIKVILNDKEREEYHKGIIQRDKKIKEDVKKTQSISEMIYRYHPCVRCRLNKKKHWDAVHFHCEKNHKMSCNFLQIFNNIISEIFGRNIKLNESDISFYEEKLKENCDNTSKVSNNEE